MQAEVEVSINIKEQLNSFMECAVSRTPAAIFPCFERFVFQTATVCGFKLHHMQPFTGADHQRGLCTTRNLHTLVGLSSVVCFKKWNEGAE